MGTVIGVTHAHAEAVVHVAATEVTRDALVARLAALGAPMTRSTTRRTTT